MRSAAALIEAEAPPPAHPLKAWRERMGWTVSEAARQYTAHIGRAVVPQTWRRWELAREDPESRIPSYDDMIGLRGFTEGAVTADSFYPERSDAAPAADDGGGG